MDGALGCALVDLTTGLPLALDVKPNSLLDAAAMELMSVAGVTYFTASSRMPFDEQSDPGGGLSAADSVQEIQATTEETYHFISLVPGDERELLILIVDRHATNLGLSWMSMRQARALMEKASTNGASEGSSADAAPIPTVEPAPPQPSSSSPQLSATRARGRRTVWGQR